VSFVCVGSDGGGCGDIGLGHGFEFVLIEDYQIEEKDEVIVEMVEVEPHQQ
jgi:hypothetical protein